MNDQGIKSIAHPSSDVLYLFAYPRSGSTWFRYCLEFITKRQTNETPTPDWPTEASMPRFTYFTHDWDDEDYKLHTHLDKPSPKHIWLVRNYKEAVMSQVINYMSEDRFIRNALAYFLPPSGWSPEIFQNLGTATVEKRIIAFEFLINTSSNWAISITNELGLYYNLMSLHYRLGNGLAVRYEELIIDPKSALTRTIDYLDKNFTTPSIPSRKEMINNMNKLMEDFEYHNGNCLTSYTSKPSTRRAPKYLAASTKHGNKKLNYYSKQLSKTTRLLLDTMLIEGLDPNCAKKYVSSKHSAFHHKFLAVLESEKKYRPDRRKLCENYLLHYMEDP